MKKIILHSLDIDQAVREIATLGGRVLQTFNRVILAAELPGHVSPSSLRHSTDALPANLAPLARIAGQAWMRNQSPSTKARAQKHTDGLPWDAPGHTPPKLLPTLPASVGAHADGERATNQLRGSVCVGIVMVSGPGDLAFSDDEHAKVLQEFSAGLDFLNRSKPSAGLTFVVDVKAPSVDAAGCADPDHCNGNYESCEAPWRDPALVSMGYSQGVEGVRQYVDAIKQTSNAAWAYAAFVTKYPLCHFAYAYRGGARLCMNYYNGSWGVDNLHRVFAHESCHIFGALDEYDAGKCGEKQGELQVPNYNCINCSGFPHIACVMDRNTEQLCDYTKWAVGWSNRLLTGDETVGPAGGSGGDLFEDGPLPADARVFKIMIRHGSLIDAVGIGYTSGGQSYDGPMHGGDGGDLSEFTLDDDEYVTEFHGRRGSRIDSLIIRTNKRTSGVYGGDGGDTYFQFGVPPNLEFVGFSGRSASDLDAIGAALRLRSSGPVPTLDIITMGTSGGTGGDDFQDDRLPAGARLAKVRVRHGSRIDAIGISYELNGQIVDGPMHGGDGGDLTEFAIDAGDFLMGVSGRYGDGVDSLILQTANGVYSQRFGGDGGDADFGYILSPAIEIVGFNGRCGGELDALGANFHYRS